MATARSIRNDSERPLTSKPFALIGLVPAPDVASFDAVPWYRRERVALFPLLVPATILIALTGDIFHRANDRTRAYSDADVWRYGRAARVFFVVVATLATMGVVSVVASW